MPKPEINPPFFVRDPEIKLNGIHCAKPIQSMYIYLRNSHKHQASTKPLDTCTRHMDPMGNESTKNIQQQLIEQTSFVYLWTPINPWQNQGSKALTNMGSYTQMLHVWNIYPAIFPLFMWPCMEYSPNEGKSSIHGPSKGCQLNPKGWRIDTFDTL